MSERVLFVTRSPAYGGVEVVIVSLLKGIDYGRNTVVLASGEDVFSVELSRHCLPVEVVPLSARFSGPPGFVLFSWLRFLARLRPHKVVFGGVAYTSFPVSAVLAACIITRGRAYLIQHHEPSHRPRTHRKHWGFVPGIGLWWYRQVWAGRLKARLVRKTVAVAESVRECLVRECGFPAARIEVARNGVDSSWFSPASAERRRAARAELGIAVDATVVVSTARLHEEKRLDRLIGAFGALKGVYENLWLLFTGEGPARSELEVLARSVAPEGRVRFLGHVPDIRVALHASDLYVLPSDDEGFGLALAEAMACGLVCVATATMGPREIVEDNRTGFLVERSGEGVLDGLRRALALTLLERQRMGAEARRAVVERFNLDRAVAQGLKSLGIGQAKNGATSP